LELETFVAEEVPDSAPWCRNMY